MRPSRQPLRGCLRIRTFLNATNDIPHTEERPLRDAARGGSSGEGMRLEARDAALVRFLDTLVIGKA